MSQYETIVLGASGYAGAECLRLVAGHPNLTLAAAISESQAGRAIGSVFPHLQSSFDQTFCSLDDVSEVLGRAKEPVAVFSAANHGASAGMVQRVLSAASKSLKVVDMSADFRYRDAVSYQAVYGHPHGAPELLSKFVCGVPEHASGGTGSFAGQPGCFTTAVVLAAVPLLKLELVAPDLYVVGVTGSTGSGREPKPATHHPERQSNLFAYQPLAHRHEPEMTSLTEAATGVRPAIHFVPHSGPFSRGIHATLQAKLRASLDADAIRSEIATFYKDAPFVRVVDGTPRVKDVVGSNFAHLGVATNGDTVAVFSVIDNLLKGAAGGSMQWMNRLLGLPETAGLLSPGPPWI
jgi:N-acetyl-gamma-glutamyl-phosphate reductase